MYLRQLHAFITAASQSALLRFPPTPHSVTGPILCSLNSHAQGAYQEMCWAWGFPPPNLKMSQQAFDLFRSFSFIVQSRPSSSPCFSPSENPSFESTGRGLPGVLEKHDEWQESNITSPPWHSITRTSTIELADVMYSLLTWYHLLNSRFVAEGRRRHGTTFCWIREVSF